MPEDSTQNPDPNQLQKYEPQPRGKSRIDDIDLSAIDNRLAECSEYFTKHVDEADYRNLDWYLWRMQLHYAAGDDIFQIVDDAFLAARCLHDRHEMHLDLKPPEMFMTRRITPVELGILSGMPMLTLEFSATYGLPLMMVMGNTAPDDIMSETHLMTSYFRRGFCADFVELTGLSAVIYAGVIAAIGRGFDDEATVGLNTYAKARDSLRGQPPKSLLAKLERYDSLNTALACLCAGQYQPIGGLLASAAENFASEQIKKSASSWKSPDKMPVPKYFDLSIVTILALGVLRGVVIELPETGPIAGYRDFLKGLTEMPERRLEMPELDEEARKILQEAGVDPDQIAGNYMDHSIQDAKEASEARAAELFEERQRKAQDAVREKILQDAKAEREKAEAEDNSKHSDNSDDGKKSGNYANFFDNLKDNEIPKVDDETHDHEAKSGNFANFFDNLDENAIPKFDDGSGDENANQVKTFSADFFTEEHQVLHGLKMTLDPEPEPEKKTEKVEEKPKSEPEYVPSIEDNSPRRDFTRLFDENVPEPTLGLKMSLDEEEDQKIKEKAHQQTILAPKAQESQSPAESNGRDFSHFFEDEEKSGISAKSAVEIEREAQIRELEEAQAQKLANQRQNVEALKLKLDGSETETKVAESYQERMARIIAEKQAAAREAALKEREDAARELEELKAKGVQKPGIEQLQLTPTQSTDPDEHVEKMAPDDLVIQRFAYTELDRIHDNTAQTEDLEEDFDMYAALNHPEKPT